jgi:tetratricopeptide (TPR) repeat protein
MRKLSISLLLSVASIGGTVMAQTVEQGKQFLYYERFKSAQETFEKVLAANPNNIDAVYWLGQTMIHRRDTRDTAGAKALYQKMLTTNGDAPMLLVGIGHVELLYGNTTDSRQRFETAIKLTKEKDVDVLNAVAYANTDSKAGDANYAIQKLMMATETRRFNNAETYILLGDAYRKLLDGGNAVTNYQKALTLDPKLAEAKMKIGIIYLTQNNRDYFLPAFEDAVTIDPAYAPAYEQLFLYWYTRDVNKASAYLDKYLANSDQGPAAEYLKTDMLYASSKFSDARTRAQQLIAQYGEKVIPRMYRMVAYASDTLGDIQGAKAAMTTFFQKADTSSDRGIDYTILPTDYEEFGKIYSKMPDSASQAMAFPYYEKAIATDTLVSNQERYATAGLELAKKLKNIPATAQLSRALYATQKEPSNSDLYKFGMANYSIGNYKLADSIFCGVYEAKYPDEIYGYLWCAKTKQAQDDSVNSQGLAVEAYEKLAKFARSIPDSAKYKNQIIGAYYYLASYYNDIKKDKDKAIECMQKVLEVDPGNASAQNIINMLTKPPARQPAPRGKGTHSRSGE